MFGRIGNWAEPCIAPHTLSWNYPGSGTIADITNYDNYIKLRQIIGKRNAFYYCLSP